MSGRTGEAARGSDDPAALLTLVYAQPAQALARARELLATDPGPSHASFAHQAIGLVERDFGHLTTALTHLRTALRLARRSGEPERIADVRATLGIALVHAGRGNAGLAMLDHALTSSSGPRAARIRFRRAGAFWLLGRPADALNDARAVLPVLRRAGDVVWTARALNVRALAHVALGHTSQAERDFAVAAALFATTDQDHERAVAVFNRGVAAYRGGDLPGALARLDEAERLLGPLVTRILAFPIERCGLLMAAGLPGEALAEADRVLATHDRRRGQLTRRSELVLVAARAALAAGRTDIARERAHAAVRAFAGQGSRWWVTHARLLKLQASFAAGAPSGRLLRDARLVAERLADLGSADATHAHLLAGRVALAVGRPDEADVHLARAARRRERGAPLGRVAGWLAQALRGEAAGDARRTLHACRRGLAVLDELLLTLGAGELRSQATVHGTELAGCALRASLRSGHPRDLLTWSERWRATALSVPTVRPVADARLQRDLAALRDLNVRADQARATGEPSVRLERERRRLEREVAARTRRVRAIGRIPDAFDVGELLGALGEGQLVELFAVDGELRVLLCGGRRVRSFRAGRLADAVAEVEYARAALRRLAFARPGASPAPAQSTLDAHGTRLERLLLGEAASHLRHGPVTIVPPGLLHATPFALLPSLRKRAFAVAPSARAWLRAHRAELPAGRGVVLVRGPGLAHAGSEVDTLGGTYAHSDVLADGNATAEKVLAALDGAWLAHLAAHGNFRADSPLFSSLELDDGPLTVHDLHRLRRAPYRLILPSCDSGQLAAVGADELLGLAAALLPLGTAALVASVVPVNDRATVEVMLALHGALKAGEGVAQALLAARLAQPDDPVRRATALSYVAIGAG